MSLNRRVLWLHTPNVHSYYLVELVYTGESMKFGTVSNRTISKVAGFNWTHLNLKCESLITKHCHLTQCKLWGRQCERIFQDHCSSVKTVTRRYLQWKSLASPLEEHKNKGIYERYSLRRQTYFRLPLGSPFSSKFKWLRSKFKLVLGWMCDRLILNLSMFLVNCPPPPFLGFRSVKPQRNKFTFIIQPWACSTSWYHFCWLWRYITSKTSFDLPTWILLLS